MQAILKDCRTIEQLAAQTYRRLAADTRFDARVRATFRRLAADEDDHARQFELALELPAERLDAVTRIAWQRVEKALEEARNLLERANGGTCSEKEALELAMDLENRFLQMHLDNVVHFHEPSAAALFENLARSDQEHLETLRECLAWWRTQSRSAADAGGGPSI